MQKLNIISWNVNGIRAVMRNGFLDWFRKEAPDILCLQETRAHRQQVEKEFAIENSYYEFWNSAERKGYSGVAVFSKTKPISESNGLGINRFDGEGRVILLEYPNFTLLNIYFPHGQRDHARVPFKMEFCDAVLEYCEELRGQGRRLIICGDFNTSHREIDLENPRQNEKTSGFLPIERAWMNKFISFGYIDIFRHFHPNEPGHYTWWSYRFNARARNIGWRIDYFFVTEDLVDVVENAYLLPEVKGSDHCPVGLGLSM